MFPENSNCKTPKNIPGTCKEIESCESLLALVENRPINSANADFLIKSRCGTSDDSTKVCCPISDAENMNRNGPAKSYETRTKIVLHFSLTTSNRNQFGINLVC